MFFGWRARDEHHRAKYGDIKIKYEYGPEGREYVEWIIERGSKTRTGEHEFVPDRKCNPKMFAIDGPRCPVKIFKEYYTRREVRYATVTNYRQHHYHRHNTTPVSTVLSFVSRAWGWSVIAATSIASSSTRLR